MIKVLVKDKPVIEFSITEWRNNNAKFKKFAKGLFEDNSITFPIHSRDQRFPIVLIVNGDDLEELRKVYEGVPIIPGDLCVWTGEWATFILVNLLGMLYGLHKNEWVDNEVTSSETINELVDVIQREL